MLCYGWLQPWPIPVQSSYTNSRIYRHFIFVCINSSHLNPTRLTSYSATLIDNIFTNNLSQNVLNGVVLNDLSDHLPVFAYFSGQTPTRDQDNKAFTGRFIDENLRKFNENVSNTNWSSFLDEDPNMTYNNFIDEYSRIYNPCFPLKAIKGKLLNNRSSPWISPGLLKSINKKPTVQKIY